MPKENTPPSLYNWVRAIKKISLISAIYTTLVLLASLFLFFSSDVSEPTETLPYSFLATLIATILLTSGVRSILLQKLIQKFKSTFSFELLLASWCILLILIHLQCQLLNLMLFRSTIPLPLAYAIFVFCILVLFFTWPKLNKIQSLLQKVSL